MYDIPAVIFAGGKSSRMGTDKALLPFGGHSTLSEFQYHKLSKLFSQVYISAKENKFDFACNIIEDKYAESSPLVGLISIFETLDVNAVFVLSVDTPLVNTKTIEKLFLESEESSEENIDAIIAQSPSGLQALCAIYKRSILPLAQTHLAQNNHRLQSLLESSCLRVVSFSTNTPFTNLNTQKEYADALLLG